MKNLQRIVKSILSLVIFLHSILYLNLLQAKSDSIILYQKEIPKLTDSTRSKIIVRQKQKNGGIKEIGSEMMVSGSGKHADPRQILGSGQYEIIFNEDSTLFSESWLPLKGNFIHEFKGENIRYSRWIGDQVIRSEQSLNYHSMLAKRFTARLIECVVEEGLINLGFNANEVRSDIMILDQGTTLDGKFVCFSTEEIREKYIIGWRKRIPTPTHKSKRAYNSSEIFRADVLISVYDGRKNASDSHPLHIGLIRKGLFNHSIEALSCLIPWRKECNLAKKNALRIRRKA